MMLRTFIRYCPDSISKFATASYFKIGSLLARGRGQFHSAPQTLNFRSMKVKIIPALKDNYMYLIIDENTNEAAAVDPVEPTQLLSAVTQEDATLTTVLTTHHHWDHAGGNKELLKLCPKIKIYGGDDRIDGLTHKLSHNDKINVGQLTVRSLFTPCHTRGHMCYYIELDNEPSVVFTGDTLFTAGCGRFFEGTPSEMYRALIEVLGKLPDDTKVFCGHEYGVSNLNFAAGVEPSNAEIRKRLEWAMKQREMSQPTVPSTIAFEKLTNPFMRVCENTMKDYTGSADPVSVMGVLRQRKDVFKG